MLGLSCKHTGSLAVAWGISVPWPGVEPGPLHWERGVLATGLPGKSLEYNSSYNSSSTEFSPMGQSLCSC